MAQPSAAGPSESPGPDIPGGRDELIEAFADALMADLEQFLTLPMPAPGMQTQTEADAPAQTLARSVIMRPGSEPGVRRRRKPKQARGRA